jgi:catechol 2,3-dioxygenase-like lactoylglutathione lyase family enzyme
LLEWRIAEMEAPHVTLPKARLVIRSKDVNRSTRFYADGVGWKVEGEAADRVVFLRTQGGTVVLLAPPALDVRPWTEESFVELPGADGVGNTPPFVAGDLARMKERLAAHGETAAAPATLTEEMPFNRSLRVTDPDGRRLLFWEELDMPGDLILEMYERGADDLERAVKGLDGARRGR